MSKILETLVVLVVLFCGVALIAITANFDLGPAKNPIFAMGCAAILAGAVASTRTEGGR